MNQWIIQREQETGLSYLTDNDTFSTDREEAKIYKKIEEAAAIRSKLFRTLLTPAIYILCK